MHTDAPGVECTFRRLGKPSQAKPSQACNTTDTWMVLESTQHLGTRKLYSYLVACHRKGERRALAGWHWTSADARQPWQPPDVRRGEREQAPVSAMNDKARLIVRYGVMDVSVS